MTIDKTDEAISMYKRHRMYEDMLRVVKSHRPNHVKDTHIYLAKVSLMNILDKSILKIT